MLRNTKALEGARIHAIDGDMGHVEQFYFDDRNWQINYIVMNIGSWLHNKRLLMPPEPITSIEGNDRPVVHVSLTKDQISRSLDVRTHQPVSLQQSHDYYLYLGLPHYLNLTGPQDSDSTQREISDRASDDHLRSSKIVGRYHIAAVEGEIGHLDGFIIDDDTWTIRYATGETRNWWPGKKILLATEWIYWISWAESNAYVGFSREQIGKSPAFHHERPLTRDFEIELYSYYQRTPYWESQKCA